MYIYIVIKEKTNEAQNEAFVTIKRHKPNFPENVACRLLNPCKSEISKVSKVYFENISNSIRSSNNFKNCY